MRNNLLITVAMCLLSGCQLFDYGDGVKKDSERIFSQRKDYIKQIAFSGSIHEKKYCANCEAIQYSVVIKLDIITPKPSFSDIAFSPYYLFSGDTLTIGVSENIFKSTFEKDNINKAANSYDVKIGDKVSALISEKSMTWLPK